MPLTRLTRLWQRHGSLGGVVLQNALLQKAGHVAIEGASDGNSGHLHGLPGNDHRSLWIFLNNFRWVYWLPLKSYCEKLSHIISTSFWHFIDIMFTIVFSYCKVAIFWIGWRTGIVGQSSDAAMMPDIFLDRATSLAAVIAFLLLLFIQMFTGLDDGKIYRKPLYLMVKTMVSCRFSLKPIHWDV